MAMRAGSSRPAVESMPNDTGTLVTLPRCLVDDVLADGTCPLHLRLQLSRVRAQSGEHGHGQAPSLLEEAECVAVVASYLSHEDILSIRRCNVATLSDVMQRAPCEDEWACSAEWARADTPSFIDTEATGSGEDALAPSTPNPLANVHARIRCRLWLERVARLTAGTPDESIFETRVRGFVEEATRQRVVMEINAAKAAKARMEGEVQEASMRMLECARQVAAMQDEFERRTEEQGRLFSEMVEKKVHEQTSALQAEVDRYTEFVRSAMEQRAQEYEAATARLRAERSALEDRVLQQEAVASRVAEELQALRCQFAELSIVREVSKDNAAEQDALTRSLPGRLTAALAASTHEAKPRQSKTAGGCVACWAFFATWRRR